MLELLLLTGCIETGGVVASKSDTTTTDSTYTPYYTPSTTDTDGDLDDDGYTPEDGDCDDDNVLVSPAREEDPEDNLDNDCDGRTDEVWAGVTAAMMDTEGVSDLVTLDTLGEELDSVRVGGDCMPNFLAAYGSGWVASGAVMMPGAGVDEVAVPVVMHIDEEGDCTPLAEFSDPDEYPYGVYGVATTPDGRIFATTVGALHEIDLAGSLSTVAEWVCNLDDPDVHEAAVTGLVWDLKTGTLGLFDYFGGFATWDETTGLNLLLKGDIEYPAITTFTGTVKDGGDFFAPGVDTVTGDYGLYRFDRDGAAWELGQTWTASDWAPSMLAINSDTGDGYVTANRGAYQTVWRLNVATGVQADFYQTQSGSTRSFAGIISNYDE